MKNERPENKGEIEAIVKSLFEWTNEYFASTEDKYVSVFVEEISSPTSLTKVFKIVIGYDTVNIPIPSHIDPTTIDEKDYNKREQLSFVWNTEMTIVDLVKEVDRCISYIKDVKVITNKVDLEDHEDW